MGQKIYEKPTPEKPIEEAIKVRGFFRLQLENPDGKIVGDSGWKKNMITNTGFQHYIVQLMGGSAGSSRVTHAALGTGSQPGATGTSLEGEVEVRQTTTFSEVGSKTCQWVCTFNSGLSFVTNTQNISNIGLFATSTQGSGSILCGNTYASSSCATNQNVNVTYQIQFSTS